MRLSIQCLLATLIFLLSCSSREESDTISRWSLIGTDATGLDVPDSLILVPKAFTFNEPASITLGQPKVVSTNTYMKPAGPPMIITAGSPKITTPGEGNFSLPMKFPIKDSVFAAGVPEVVVVRDPTLKDENPLNFSSFGKLQGLKNSIVRCMLEDKEGNLWLGTNGGGVTKYDGKYFTHFTRKEGLNNGTLRSMLEDKEGNLWFGTGAGISKYDGSSFTHFSEPEKLSHLTVRAMTEDKVGNIWFGTSEGVYKYMPPADGKPSSFSVFLEKEGLMNTSVWSMLADHLGNIWIGTEGGLAKFDGHSFYWYTKENGLIDDGIISLLEDSKGNIWFGTYEGGITKFEENGIKSFTHYTEKEGLGNEDIWSMMEDKNGDLWFGTSSGITKFDGKSFGRFTQKEGFSDMEVFAMLEDKRGGLWFSASYRGVLKYEGNVFTHYTESEGLSHNVVYAALEDSHGDLWFATDKGGVSKYDGSSFSHFTESEGLLLNQVRSILEDQKGNLWFGTNGDGVSRLTRRTYNGNITYSFTNFAEKEGLVDGNIWCSMEDNKGNIWFGTNNGVSKISQDSSLGTVNYTCTNFTVQEGLSDNRIQDMLQDKNGNIWFATDNGLTEYHENTFTHFLPNEEVRSILEDKNGWLWFGTSDGALKYDGKTFTYITEEQGLITNYVTTILEDHHGDLWFGTRMGLSKLSISEFHDILDQVPTSSGRENENFITNYTYENGFLGLGCNTNAMLEDQNGTIWIGTNDRLTAYHPEGESKDTIAPNTQITGIALFNEPIDWTSLYHKQDSSLLLENGVKLNHFRFDGISKWHGLPTHLSLPYNNNYITFSYIAITLKNPAKVKYKYKLEGNDAYWSAITTNTEAPYGSLAPGSYTFTVKAMNSAGYWSEALEYPFTIRPPWWKTWWAYILYGLILLTGIWRLDLYQTQRAIRAEKEKAQKRELQQAKEIEKAYAELKATQAQLIQSEKMASLGELTAGIAHEIQNPLNFVNNFSEVSNELIIEMREELDKGDIAEAKSIATDIEQNLQKITHHGKRADGIVKGMLQHSRSGSGDKEPTDINALCDEYLRLAYHGHRAKDKSFNATMETDFDDSIPLIKIVPQDIGRVILNLITNAFYAVSAKATATADVSTPKSPKGDLPYEPIVTVKTKLLKPPTGGLGAGAGIEISVRDNGNGIPPHILDKIFQPFFTTKPTGQGTGLGLSLAYDIVKAHGGKINVKSTPGNTLFTITLPQTLSKG